MTSLNASDLFIKALENEGVEEIYGVPGEENLPLLEAIRKSNIKLILNRHEQAAAFMAATYGRLTGKVGVAISTLGPGATNFTTAAAYANLGGFPLLMITGQKPIKSSKQGRFQVIDAVSMMRPITKYTKQICNVGMVSSVVREAFREAVSERPGAVHIEFPEDISEEAVHDNTVQPLTISNAEYPSANKNSISDLVKVIVSAKAPLFLIGAACSRHDISIELTNLVNKTKIPFISTQMGKGAISDYNEYCLGTGALSSTDYVHEVVKNSDLIINIGYDVIEKPAYFLEKNANTTIVHINYLPASVDNIYNPSLEIVGDIKSSLTELYNQVKPKDYDYSLFNKVKDILSKHNESYIHDNSFPVKPGKIVSDINKVMGEDGIVALDNGMYKLWFTRNYKAASRNTLLVDNALATMGAGLPAAMEAKLAFPERKVVAVVGDGGFMMNSQELETAVRLKLNLIVLILNDSAYGMIRWKQSSMGFTDYGLEFNNPDFIKYADSYGCTGHKLEKTEDLENLINECHHKGGVHIIDVPVDYSDNKTVLIDELNNKNIH